MTDSNQPNNDQSWIAPPPGFDSQPGDSQPRSEPSHPDQPDQSGDYQFSAQPSEYGQAQYPAEFAGGMPVVLPVAQRRSGKVLAIAGLALVLVLVAAAVATRTFTKHDHDQTIGRTFSIPTQAGAYVQQTGAQSADVGAGMLTALKGQDPTGLLGNPAIGVYGRDAGATPEVVVIGLDVADNKELRHEIASKSIGDEASYIFDKAGGTESAGYDAGSLGGALQCGVIAEPHGALGLCLWLDRSTCGIVLQVGGTPDQTADITRAIRAAGEH